ncbi:hypothetical protein JKP88DRAFT_256421 [Tribonema minus]|uniref:Uncharacterized protein n=1 Tax=Tribonema minus TaxID=303371 RepID=A0A836CH98_9STRA|nr:hypothetical protein JKP88DRAFT_256421 [Tribonema minus]
MTDRKVFDLFFGAREGDLSACKAAYEAGANVNFQYEGKKATRGAGGRWYYGDLIWHAPDSVDANKNETLLMIAIKANNKPLVDWLLTLDRLDVTVRNIKGQDAFQVATEFGRSSMLTMVATPPPAPAAAGTATAAAASAARATATPAAVTSAPPSVSADAEEIKRQCNAIKLLTISNDTKEEENRALKAEVERCKQVIKEKDATIGELQNTVFSKEREMIVMMHKMEQLQATLAEYTDVRQGDAAVFEQWGQARFHGQDRAA